MSDRIVPNKDGTGIERIAAERIRQTEKLGWTREHDDQHEDGELAYAAACYAAPERIYIKTRKADEWFRFFDPFPTSWKDARPARTDSGLMIVGVNSKAKRIRLLEKAGALIAAEIDRLLRGRV